MKYTTLFALLALPALLTGCASMKVSSECSPSYDFSQVESYQWTEPSAELMKSGEAYVDFELQKALNNELAAMGWKQVLDDSEATIQAAYSIQIQSHKEFSETLPDDSREFSGGLVFNRDDGEWNYEERGPNRIEYVVETGTFHLLLRDAADGGLIWHGTVETEIDRSLPPEERNERFIRIAGKLAEELADDIR
jgi:hypothetical protein